MRDRDRNIAERLGLLDQVEEFEKRLLEIKHVAQVEFDLDCLEDLHQLIFLPKYDIPVELPNYYDVRREMLRQVLDVAKEFGLSSSGDRIEDYGEHFYIVRNCDDSWKPQKEGPGKENNLERKSLDELIIQAERYANGPDDGGPGGGLAMEDPRLGRDGIIIRNYDEKEKELFVGPPKPKVIPER